MIQALIQCTLVDTGSDITLVLSEIFSMPGFNQMSLNHVSENFNTADGDPLVVIEMKPISFCIGEQSVLQTASVV